MNEADGIWPVLLGVGFLLSGLAFATNFRGFTERHVRFTFLVMSGAESVLRHVPPWRWLLRRPLATRIESQIKRERFVGVVLACAGLAALIEGLVNLFAGW